MNRDLDKEQPGAMLANRKAVNEFLSNRPAADKLKDMVENHIMEGETILGVISDVVEMGWRESDGDDRYHSISVLLQQYRDGNRKFIDKMYAFVKRAEKAA